MQCATGRNKAEKAGNWRLLLKDIQKDWSLHLHILKAGQVPEKANSVFFLKSEGNSKNHTGSTLA